MGRAARILRKSLLRLRAAAGVLVNFDDDLRRSRHKVSFSQCGEDMIAWFLLDLLGIRNVAYVDVGAHDPVRLSNTALLHLLGHRGINVEPDPRLFASFPRARPSDVNLNIGIARTAGRLPFFRMADAALSTFSEAEARRMQAEEGIAIDECIEVPVRPLGEILSEHECRPDFLSVDVEGLDVEVLQSFDLARVRPAVVCVETISFSLAMAGRKNAPLQELMAEAGYLAFADTYINTIFVDEQLFRSARS